MRYGYKKWCAMGRFPVKKFESAGKFSYIFESVAKNLKFENLPVAHGQCGALRVTFFACFPRHTPPLWTIFLVFQKIKENDTKIEKNSKIQI
jgi:hypothetical protein